MEREIILYKKHFLDFYHQQNEKIQEKIEYVFDVIRYEQQVPVKFLKNLEGTNKLYEIRIKVGSNIYRIFCFFDKGKLVVLLNAFQKKSQKTPRNEIKLAEKLKKEYYERD